MANDPEAEGESGEVSEVTEALAEAFGEVPEEIEREASEVEIEHPADADAEYIVSRE